jgi:hypothetical protein
MMHMQRLSPLFAFVGALILANCGVSGTPQSRSEICREAFQNFDAAVRSFPNSRSGDLQPNSRVSRYGQQIFRNGCITRQPDLIGLDATAERLKPFRIEDSGAPTRATAVAAGIVDGFSSQAVVSSFFSSLGYRTRSVGASGVGRQILIGPFYSEGAIAQAIDVARQAGFISPYPSINKF